MTENDATTAELYLAEVEYMVTALRPGSEFVCASLLKRMTDDGWQPLKEPRQVGGLLVGLRNRGLIRKVDVRPTPARSNGGLASVWQRTDHTPDPNP